MVVDKDVEGLGEWTLGEVKTEWVRTLAVLLLRWETQSWGYVCKIGQLPLHWEDHDLWRTWCVLQYLDSLLGSLIHTSLHLAVPSLSLHTPSLFTWGWGSTSSLSGPGIIYSSSLHTCSQFGSQTLHTGMWLCNLREGTFPRPSPTTSFCPTS